MNNKKLYDSIMRDVSKVVKKHINESSISDDSQYLIGKTVRIINMKGEEKYNGRKGIVDYIDGIGQLHGTWGGLAIIPEEDEFEVLD